MDPLILLASLLAAGSVSLVTFNVWAAVTGEVPADDAEKIAAKAHFKLDDIRGYEKTQHHELTAFLDSVADSLGPESRWVHYGLTTSDVWDTATALQLCQAADLLLADIDALSEAVGERAREHKHTLQMGRTHGVHAEPITFGLKLALW